MTTPTLDSLLAKPRAANASIDTVLAQMERDARAAVEHGHAGTFKNWRATGTGLWNVPSKAIRSIWDNKEKRYDTATNLAVGGVATVVGLAIAAGTMGVGTPAAVAIAGGIYLAGKSAAYAARKGRRAVSVPPSRDWLANYKVPTKVVGVTKDTADETWKLTTEALRSSRRIGLRFNLALEQLARLDKISDRLSAHKSGPAFGSVDEMRDAFRTSARFIHESAKAQNSLLVCLDTVLHLIGAQAASMKSWKNLLSVCTDPIAELLAKPADVCKGCKVCYHQQNAVQRRGFKSGWIPPAGLTIGPVDRENDLAELARFVLGCDNAIRNAMIEAKGQPRTSKAVMEGLRGGKQGTEDIWLDEHIIGPIFQDLENPKGLAAIGHNIRNQWMKSTGGEKIGRGIAEVVGFVSALAAPALTGSEALIAQGVLNKGLGEILTVRYTITGTRSVLDLLTGILAPVIATASGVSGGAETAKDLELDVTTLKQLSEGKIKRLFIKSEELFEKSAMHMQLAANSRSELLQKFDGKELPNCDAAFALLVHLHEFMHHFDKVTKYTCENLYLLANFILPIIQFTLLEANHWNTIHHHGATYFYNMVHGAAK